MRGRRAELVSAMPQTVRALVFNRPPQALVDVLPADAVIGCYHAAGDEAPTLGWIRWFHENGWQIALPRLAGRSAEMSFHRWIDPWDDSELEPGLHAIPQPGAAAAVVEPQALIVPGLAFTAEGLRLGQGGGHYDRWLGAHPGVLTIGLAWDVQVVDELPTEPHDHTMNAVVTPTRVHWCAG